MARPMFLAAMLAGATWLAACGSIPVGSPTPTPSSALTASPPQSPAATTSPVVPTPSLAPSPTRSPVASTTLPPGAVVVTFAVGDETYRVLLTEPDDIAIARMLLAGEEAPTIPNGLIMRGVTGINEGWSWSIDPESIGFADVTMEVCDGLPSHVEDGTLAGDRFCPWSAEVLAVD